MRTCVLISTVCLLAASALAGWIPLNSGTTTDLEDVCFPVDAVTGYAVGGGGLILKTTDGGATWDSLPGSHPGWQMAVHFPVDAVTGFAVASGGRIIKTTDGGATWEKESAGVALDLRSVCFPVDAETGYVCGG